MECAAVREDRRHQQEDSYPRAAEVTNPRFCLDRGLAPYVDEASPMAPNHTSSRVRFVRGAGILLAAMVVPGLSSASLYDGQSTPTAPRKDVLSTVETPRAATGPCPSSMAHVGTSCVDKYEASLVEILEGGHEAPFSPYAAPNGHNVRAVSSRGVVPQAHISMNEAKRACAASHKRLCRAAEWKSACKGPDATRYPYGNERVAGACVDTNRRSPMSTLHGGEHTFKTLNDPLANQQRGTVEPTGASASCTNGFGVHDMVGNVHEWTDDGSFRGGYYLDTKLNGEGCDYRTTAHARDYYDYSTGFRCCADEGSLSADDDS